MRTISHRLSFLSLLFSIILAPLQTTQAADFKREVIYQIITDRFFDGSTTNNNPSQSAGLVRLDQNQLAAYWGGDLQGIQQKMSYLAGMGVTAIWISPPVDNLNTNIPDGGGNPTASYHGYQGRDFKRIEEHFGNSEQHLDRFRRDGYRRALAWHQSHHRLCAQPFHAEQRRRVWLALRQRHLSR